MGHLYTADQLPSTSADAIRVFDERYLAGLSAVEPNDWPSLLGDVVDVDSPLVRFPVGLLTTKYRETRENSGRFTSMLDEYFDLQQIEYDTGYEAKLIDLLTNAFAYRNWSNVPARFVTAEHRFVNRAVATMLEDTAQTSPWDGVAFFSASHKASPSGDVSTTWSNLQASAKDVTDLTKLTEELALFSSSVRDENGDLLDVEADTIIVPAAKAEPLKLKLAQAMVLGTTSATAPATNPFLGRFNVIKMPELTDADDWYLVDSKLLRAQGLPLFVAAKYRPSADLGLRVFDETSDYFKNTGKIKISSHIWHGFGLVFPHAIRKVIGA